MKAPIRKIAWAALAGVCMTYCYSQDHSEPPWKATVTVVDESSRPVAGADVTIGYYVKPPEGQDIATGSTKGKTDTNGVSSASGRTLSVDLSFGAGKEGCYRSHLDYELGAAYQYDPVKWSPSVTLLLKRIIRPVPMYAKSLNTHVPAEGKPVGFDLTVGDWIAPHGKGKNTDMLFTVHLDRRSEDDYDYKLVVSFPNPGDGIQAFALSDLEKTSALRSPQEAPQNGYRPEWIKTRSRRPSQPSTDALDESLNFFLRVRTVLDERGNVKSALYGKIYGDFMHFRYYLNPAPNDRGMEFDPKHNLLTHVKSFERVDAP